MVLLWLSHTLPHTHFSPVDSVKITDSPGVGFDAVAKRGRTPRSSFNRSIITFSSALPCSFFLALIHAFLTCASGRRRKYKNGSTHSHSSCSGSSRDCALLNLSHWGSLAALRNEVNSAERERDEGKNGAPRQSQREEAEKAETQNERITEQFPSWGSGRLSTSWIANQGLRFH